MGAAFFEAIPQGAPHTPEMRLADRSAGLGRGLFQAPQRQIEPLIQQLLDPLDVDPALTPMPSLRRALHRPGLFVRGVDLPRPSHAHIEPDRQLTNRPLVRGEAFKGCLGKSSP